MVEIERRMELRTPLYYTQDDGCEHSEGKGCLECPWYCCVDGLNVARKNMFFRAREKDGAVEWRRKDG